MEKFEKTTQGIREFDRKTHQVSSDMKEKVAGYILAGFGFVAGLAWNEAVKALIDSFIPMDKGSAVAKFVYAIFVTVLLVFVANYLAKEENGDS